MKVSATLFKCLRLPRSCVRHGLQVEYEPRAALSTKDIRVAVADASDDVDCLRRFERARAVWRERGVAASWSSRRYSDMFLHISPANHAHQNSATYLIVYVLEVFDTRNRSTRLG